MSTIQPPVQLSADMDKGQQAAFINQNFQNMATFLQSDFLKVVKRVTTPFNISSGATGATGSFTLTHSLGYQPIALGTVTITSSSFGSTGVLALPYMLPNITSFAGLYEGAISAAISLTTTTNTDFTFGWVLMQNQSISGTVNMYILQETATI